MLTTRAISEAVEFVGSVVRIFVTCFAICRVILGARP